ncbi:uncharacterized protein [Nicotiana tomentosiformis]|uniref:uncharacterized protein n=1 Tax=Nicotiana tomentosiformis TaxID=4098 RepID=UPI00388CC88A
MRTRTEDGYAASPWFPGVVQDLAGWIRQLAASPRGRGGPEADKDKKRRKASPPDTPRPKKSRAQKSKTDLAVLPADVVQTLRDKDEEGEDINCLLVAWKRDRIEASKAPEQATTLHREASSKYRAELAQYEANLKKVQQKAELVEQLREEAKMKEAETLGATSEAEALVASYRAIAEAANTRAKEISDAAEVRLSRVAEHAGRQSQRETLEEVHARGFDLTADIESAKILEDEAGALLSDDEDCASVSESGEDEAPEDAAPEAD